jgi:hypothetical protein
MFVYNRFYNAYMSYLAASSSMPPAHASATGNDEKQ